MPTLPLTTKLYSPAPLRKLVARPRLIERLEKGLAQGRQLTIVSASAGFGKTTLIADWLRLNKHTTAWLSLDDGDNDPIRFWRYAIAALQTIDPSWGAAALAMMSAPHPPPIESVVTMVINDLVKTANPIVLVLDDYHVITESQIHTSLDFLLDRLPPQLQVVIATREDPPLSLPRRRARAELTEIRASDLRFTMVESTEFLKTLMQLDLTQADIEALEQRTEGWAVGLQLAGLSLQGRSDQHAFIATFAGDDRYIADYLIEEVIQRQSPAVQEFLLKTASLSRFCADLCDVVFDRRDSRSVLTDLERGNLFVVPLDNRREWYRYHRLFADLLRQRLIGSIGEAELAQLHQRASGWFEQHDLLDEAIGQSLIAHDFDRAAQLIEKHNVWMFQHSELQTLADYTAALPPSILNQRLPLLAMRSWALLATGHYAEAARCVKSIQQIANVDDASWSRWNELTTPAQAALIESSAMSMRFAIDQGDIDHALALAQHLLPRLNNEQQVWLYNPSHALRPPIRFMQGMAYEFRGDLRAAETEFRAASQEGVENQHIVALAIGHLGNVLMQQGYLHASADTYRQALDLSEALGRYSSPFVGVAQVGYGNLLYEWNDLDAAQQHLQEGITLGQSWNSWEAMIPGYLGLARVKQAQADWNGALAALDEMVERNHGYSPSVPQLADSLRAWLWLQQGRLDAVDRWAHNLKSDLHQDITFTNEDDLLLLAQLLIAQDRLSEADQLLDRLIGATKNDGRCQRYLTALLLRALVFNTQARSREALQLVNDVLTQAEPEGYVRTFIDLGNDVASLLYHAIDHQPTSRYAQRLLSAFPETDWAKPTDRAGGLIEPLSDREIEVLNLIAQGLSNQEIATKLVLAIGTIKVHTSNIYGKLGVNSRTQAVAKAQTLKIIPRV